MVNQLRLNEQKADESQHKKNDTHCSKEQIQVHQDNEESKENLVEMSLPLTKNPENEPVIPEVENVMTSDTKETTPVETSSQDLVQNENDKGRCAETKIKKPKRRTQSGSSVSSRNQDSRTSVNKGYQEDTNQNVECELETIPTEGSPPLLTTVPVQPISRDGSDSRVSQNVNTELLSDGERTSCNITQCLLL